MKNISVALKAHLAQDLTTLATMWRVTRQDGQIFTFTDASHDITYNGQTYLSSSGFTASNISTSAALNVDNLEINSMLSSATITDADLLAGKWDFALVEIFRVNYKDLTMGQEWLRKGRLGNVSSKRVAFVAELRGMTQPLQQNIGRVFAPSCDADLGDSRCTVNLATYTVTGTVTSVASQSGFTDTGRGEAADYFTGAKITFTSGLNNGLSMEVKSFSSGAFSLQLPMPYAIAPGDTYSVYAGCDKQSSTCNSKFNNIVNFRGFPQVPGTDRMVSGV